MRTTLSAIKADVGSVGGHLKPSKALLGSVDDYIREHGRDLVSDYYVSAIGDDITILMAHTRGINNPEIHLLAYEAFRTGTQVAKSQGLYGAGQDLLKDAFAGNVRGMGPAVAEMEIEERPSESFLLFTADKTSPGAFNLPLYLAFADPMFCSGLILSPNIGKGFTFTLMDVNYTESDRVIELNAPEHLYDIAALLRDTERFVVESIHSRATGEQAVSVSTTRLRNIAGKYVGKDDPIMLIRVQNDFPSTGEMLAPFAIGHYVAGFMRGSHNGPLMPVPHNTPVTFFDGPPIVSCHALCVREGRFTEAVDPFDHPFWRSVQDRITEKSLELRRQGFFGPAMLPYEELEYGGIVHRIGQLEGRFITRKPAAEPTPVG